ncbi:DUF6221 family protein [Nocardia aurea]|uniref:DUF6221 family protein n=1 Tax=Nocardia aurea TaxID=2144174 RepID=UPI0033B5C400
MTIEEFIEQRIAEDERIARTAGEGNRAHWAYDGDEVYCPDTRREHRYDSGQVQIEYQNVTQDSEGILPSVEKEQGPHIAHHDPARVLRQCAFLRGALTLIKERHEYDAALELERGDYRRGAEMQRTEPDCRSLAAIWSDHPEYRTEWKP